MAFPEQKPFFLPGGRTGCLLVHGFTATPYDMRFFGERLHARGFTVNAVRLAGHGTSVADLERSTWNDWYASLEDGLAQLRACTDRRIVIGQSLGAILSLNLAADYPDDVHAVVPISTALVASSPLVGTLGPFVRNLPSVLPEFFRFIEKGESDVADPQARAAVKAYRSIPLRSVGELAAAQAHVRQRLGEIRQPAFAIHSRQDHTCSLENVEILERELSGDVHTMILDQSFHVVSIDLDREQVAEALCDFVGEAAQPAR